MNVKNMTWIVVPGGPGLSSGYLKFSLPSAFCGWDLRFYEPFGSPLSKKKIVSIDELVCQLESVVNEHGNVGLITHSFGNYLALRLLERGNNGVKAIIMLNPLPSLFDMWKGALDKLIKKISVGILEKINMLSQSPSNGSEIFRIIYPYYIGNCSQILPVDVLFDMDSCNFISSQINGFDDEAFIEKLSMPTVSIVGERDPFFIGNDIPTDKAIVIKGVGHYPFFEDISQFTQAINQAQEFLCQTAQMKKTKPC